MYCVYIRRDLTLLSLLVVVCMCGNVVYATAIMSRLFI